MLKNDIHDDFFQGCAQVEVITSTIPPSEELPLHELLLVEEGVEVQASKAYGVGIDTHKMFIQVSVIVKRNLRTFEYRRAFDTDWKSLTDAREWILAVIRTFSDPPVDMNQPLHYVIESTSTYHMPVVMAFGGTPSIINPQLAGASKRKTDVLDARMLAFHDLTGVWAQSYIPSVDIQELRLLIADLTHLLKAFSFNF